MPIKNILLFVAFFLCTHQGVTQDRYISFELGGSGGIASINFEKTLTVLGSNRYSMRYGLSFAPIDKNNGNAFIFPVMIHGKWGKNNHFADVGIGQSFTITTRGSAFVRMPLSMGYRFEPENKRYYLRASYTPIISYLFNFQWENWAGLTFGYAF